MNVLITVGAALAVLLCAYLVVALFKPEWF